PPTGRAAEPMSGSCYRIPTPIRSRRCTRPLAAGQPDHEASAGLGGVCDEVAADAAGKPAGEREAEAGSVVAVRFACAAAGSRLEDALARAVVRARPVVPDPVDD